MSFRLNLVLLVLHNFAGTQALSIAPTLSSSEKGLSYFCSCSLMPSASPPVALALTPLTWAHEYASSGISIGSANFAQLARVPYTDSQRYVRPVRKGRIYMYCAGVMQPAK